MKRILGVISGVLGLLAALVFAGPTPDEVGASKLIVRIVSVTPNQESEVEGVLAYHAVDPTYQRVNGTTPFEVSVPNVACLDGILTAHRDGVRLGLEVRPDTPGHKPFLEWKSGHVVVLHMETTPELHATVKGL